MSNGDEERKTGGGEGSSSLLPANRHHNLGGLQRESSEAAALASQQLLSAIKIKDAPGLRNVIAETLRSTGPSVLTTSSLKLHHKHRTPFMEAAARGDLSIFVTLLHAFQRKHPDKELQEKQMQEQLGLKDVDGMTVLMHAARSCDVAMVGVILTLIKSSKAKSVLLIDEDFTSKTVLMHAASSGKAPVFQEIFKALRSSFKDDDEKVVVDQLTKRSGGNRTILMHAARSGDAMTLSAVKDACQKVCDPSTVRHIIYQTDSEGMNLLMHACICAVVPQQPPGPTGPSQTKKLNGAHDARVDSATQALNSAKRGDIQPQQGEGGSLERAKSAREKKLTSADRAKSLSLSRESSSSDELSIIEEVEAQPPDPFVPVFKVAVAFIQDCLWKRQLREQLKATDLSGRSIITHAVNSGRVQLFDAALKALRDEVLDAEVEEMLDTDEDEREDKPLRTALQRAGEPMGTVFSNRRRQLKKDVSNRSKLSTIEAKIQSFIPGKLVVIFQLLLPEIEGSNQLYLLITMSVLAPLFSLGSSLLTKEKPSNDSNAGLPRTSVMSFILSAPAMFFWGIGTSDIGSESFGWEATTAATALAVATICIPALDSFFNSMRVIQWWDRWSCQKWYFTTRVHRQWERKKAEENMFDKKDEPEYRFGFIAKETLPHTIYDTGVHAGSPDESCGTPPSDGLETRTSNA